MSTGSGSVSEEVSSGRESVEGIPSELDETHEDGGRLDEVESTLDRRLREAGKWVDTRAYLQWWLTLGLILGVLVGIVGGLAGVFLVASPQVNIGLFSQRTVVAYLVGGTVASVLGAFVGGAGALYVGYYYPVYRARRRARTTARLMPDAVSFMYALADGGLQSTDIITEVAKADDSYGVISEEFLDINRKSSFGEDTRTAVRTVARQTPSEQLSKFLLSMAGIMEEGGDIASWLDIQQEEFNKKAQEAQEQELEFIETLNQVSLLLTVIPVLIMVTLFGGKLLGYPTIPLMFALGYLGFPLLGAGMLVLISSVTQDEVIDGYLDTEEDDRTTVSSGDDRSIFSAPVFGEFTDTDYSEAFEMFRRNEIRRRVREALRTPVSTFISYPRYTLVLTVPAAIVTTLMLAGVGLAPWQVYAVGPVPLPFVDIGAMKSAPMPTTVVWVYIPVFITGVPYAVSYERKQMFRRDVVDNLTLTLRDMAEANEAGKPLLESVKEAKKHNDDALSEELEHVYQGISMGSALREEIVAMVNRVGHPRLARVFKPVVRAQRAANDISDVIRTVAEQSERHDEMVRQRRRRTQLFVALGTATFVVFAGIFVVLNVTFVPQIESIQQQLSGSAGSRPGTGGRVASLSGVDTGALSMLFFHVIVIQSFISGLTTGEMRTDDWRAGVKYGLAFSIVGAIMWQTAAATLL